MKFYLGVTDNAWFKYLSGIKPEDVNFWQPGGTVTFKVLTPGAPFLFKLKSPLNAIGGVGFFSKHTFLPMSMAWEIFRERNGSNSYSEFSNLIFKYRTDKQNVNPVIGCIVLTNPIFFEEKDWISTPADWGKSIVQGKSYESETEVGRYIWQKVELLLERYFSDQPTYNFENQLLIEEQPAPQYGKSILSKVRLGQGAFRVMVTDAYTRKCSVTGEKTLPVLEAAHIIPYAKLGSHLVSNGLLLRSDMHKLFDNGYLTVTSDYKIEVSSRIKEEFQNGREYYQYHGKELFVLPERESDRPNKNFLDWHNTNIYRG